jgi:hypothetical protein
MQEIDSSFPVEATHKLTKIEVTPAGKSSVVLQNLKTCGEIRESFLGVDGLQLLTPHEAEAFLDTHWSQYQSTFYRAPDHVLRHPTVR